MRRIAPLLLVIAVPAAGCGGSSSKHASTASAGSATVSTMTVVGYGTVLAKAGHPVYLLTADPPGASKCTGSCTSEWPPVTASGAPTTGPGVDGSKLSSFKRSDGSSQVTYEKHPLYTHKGRGLVSGAGVRSEGGIWYLVAPSGKPIKATKSGGY